MNLVINATSKRIIEAAFHSWAHALLLTGPEGVGLTTIALHYAKEDGSQVVTVQPEKDEKVNTVDGVITAALIRQLYTLTSTVEPTGRTVIIESAGRMTVPAQNAFLKLLEEPPEKTRFVLLSHQPEKLLRTITSRSQHLTVRRVTKAQSEALLDTLTIRDATKRSQLLFIAEGLPAALTQLATDKAAFSQRSEYIKDGRSYILGTSYDKLLIAYKYKDDRQGALTLLSDAMRLLRLSISTTNEAPSLHYITRLEQLSTRIAQQGNIRLQLSAGVSVV